MLHSVLARRLISALAAVLALGALPATAVGRWHTAPHARGHARVKRPPARPLGIVPARGPRGPRGVRARAAGASDLLYHGGPVMDRSVTHAIYWSPDGSASAFASDYRPAIDGYLGDIAADSGRSPNVYAVAEQYTDSGGGRASYDTSFAGSMTTTHAVPPGCSPYTGGPTGTEVSVTFCVTDAQIRDEIDRVITANGLPRGFPNLYAVLLPQNVGVCTDASGSTCAYAHGTGFCGYHQWIGAGAATTPYAVVVYSDNAACRTDDKPNGSADAAISILSHEHNEAITNPTGGGWYDAGGEENGDKCAYDYGATTGPAGSAYNQTINGRHYELQREFDNVTSACSLSPAPPAPQPLVASSAGVAGRPVAFGAGPAPYGPPTYAWSFGDGGVATGASPTHVYAQPGVYHATVTATDRYGRQGAGSIDLAIAVAPAPVPGAATRPSTSLSRSRLTVGLGALPAHALRALLDLRLRMRASCSRACSGTVRLVLDARSARRLRLAVGRRAWTLSSARARSGPRSALVRLVTGARARRALRHVRSLRLTVVLDVRGRAGGTISVRRTLLLRR